jgi:hypothetical protein
MVQWPAVQIPEHSSQVSRDSFSRCVHSKAFFKMRRMLHRKVMAHREFEGPLLQRDTKGTETSSSGTRFRGNFSMSSAPLSWRPSCCPHKKSLYPHYRMAHYLTTMNLNCLRTVVAYISPFLRPWATPTISAPPFYRFSAASTSQNIRLVQAERQNSAAPGLRSL